MSEINRDTQYVPDQPEMNLFLYLLYYLFFIMHDLTKQIDRLYFLYSFFSKNSVE